MGRLFRAEAKLRHTSQESPVGSIIRRAMQATARPIYTFNRQHAVGAVVCIFHWIPNSIISHWDAFILSMLLLLSPTDVQTVKGHEEEGS